MNVLIASSTPLPLLGVKVDVVTDAEQAITLWEARHHALIFADLGPLKSGGTGLDLAVALRKLAPKEQVAIYLMTDKPTAVHQAWAVQRGANGVVQRRPEALARVLELRTTAAPVESSPESADSGRVASATTHAADSALIEERLKTYARMGPARSFVVADAIEKFSTAHDGVMPTTIQLAHLVAEDIPDELQRALFLRSFRKGL